MVVGIALVGSGRMGKVRAPLIHANPRAKLLWVVDLMAAPGGALAAEYGASFSTELAKALADPAVDLVWITTPTFAHMEVIAASAAAGRCVFTEKPVAEEPFAIRSAFEACERGGVDLFCGFQRRFDRGYMKVRNLVAAGTVGKVNFIRVCFADSPVPPLEFLLKGGDPFMDLAPHDIDFIRWVLEEEPLTVYAIGSSSNPQLAAAGVLDTATMTLSFASGAVAQIVMTRSSTYGYDNRIEIIGELGKLEVATPPQSSVVHASAAGIATDVLQFSFPQRFREAFAAEVDAAVACVESRKRGDTLDVAAKWPISFRDCIMAQTIAMAATESQVRGAPLQISSFLSVPCAAERSSVDQRIAVRAVGNGAFGAYIRNLALSDPCLAVHFDVLSPYTRSGPNALDWKRDVLESAAVDAVYVCSPDALHKPHAIACLAAGKHVLVEKPVGPDFAEVAACAKRAERVLMVGLHRRLDAEFLRMRGEVAQRWAKRGKFSVHIESRDPCSAESDDEARARFVLNNSCVHDVDMAAWLFPDATLRVVSAAYVPGVSGFELELEASSSAGSAAAASVPYTVSITISYSKQHASYVQRGGIRCAEGTSPVFGYDHFGTFDGGEGPAGLYKAAYVAEWKEWHERMSGAGSADFARKEALHLESYTRSFALLAEVESVCFAGEERKAKRAKVM